MRFPSMMPFWPVKRWQQIDFPLTQPTNQPTYPPTPPDKRLTQLVESQVKCIYIFSLSLFLLPSASWWLATNSAQPYYTATVMECVHTYYYYQCYGGKSDSLHINTCRSSCEAMCNNVLSSLSESMQLGLTEQLL